MPHRRLISFLGFLLLVMSSQSMQMIEPAHAVCCPPPRCACCWSYMVYGSIKMQANGKAVISTEKGSTTVAVSQRVQDAFKKEDLIEDFGFIVLDGDMAEQKAEVSAFVAADRDKHNDFVDKKPGSAQSIVNFYNKAFEDFINQKGTSPQQHMNK